MTKENITELFNQVTQQMSQQDEEVLRHILLGFLKKHNGYYTRYLDTLLHMERQFTDTTSTMTLPITPLIHNFIGTPHGGIIATIADAAMGELATHSLEAGLNVVTTNMNINYLQTTTNEQLIAKGNFIRKGRTFIVMECTVEDETGKLLATASASFFTIQPRN